MSNQNFICESDSHGVGCGPPGCICIQLGPNQAETDCSCIISDMHKTIPDNSREVSEIDEFIVKVKQNIDTAIFTIHMAEKSVSEIAGFLEIFVPKEVKINVPESVQCKSVALQVEKKTMKEIIDTLGLEISETKKSSSTIRTIDRNIRVT
jgi:wyosine [tRNA(Phe)-imidazoG37] synthetase (radical SAM superfamily)